MRLTQALKISALGIAAMMLVSCSSMRHENIENKNDDDRLSTLESMSTAQLCSGYNNDHLRPKTERDIEKILRTRGIHQCDAREKVRTIPPSLTTDNPNHIAQNNTTSKAQTNNNGGKISSLINENKPIFFGGNQDVIKDIESMRKESLNKDGFETNDEYSKRRRTYSEQFKNGKGYRVSLKINNPKNIKDHLVHFNPEQDELRVELPSINQKIVYLESSKKIDQKWMHYSFIEVDTIDHKYEKYKASNQLGASVDVVELGLTRYGLAVLSRATNDYSKDYRQTFSMRASKNVARDLLENGTLVLEVVFDPRYPFEKNNPFLIRSEDRIKPKFDKPVGITNTHYAVPVRLVNLRLIDKNGTEIFSAPGQQIDVNAVIQ